jgi:hypothetical protein
MMDDRSDIKGSQCYICAENRAIRNNKQKQIQEENNGMCIIPNCPYPIHKDKNLEYGEYGEYCEKTHIKNGKVICSNYIRGCKNELVDNDLIRRSNGKLVYTKCPNCRLKAYNS